MTIALWLHPRFRLFQGEAVLSAAEIRAEAMVLAEQFPTCRRVGLVVSDALALLQALLACEQRQCDLFLIRDSAAPIDEYGLDCRIEAGAVYQMPGKGEAGTGLIWLQTSGSTGIPKWVPHRLNALLGRIGSGEGQARWLLTYHPGSFAGLQVVLSAALGGHDLVTPPRAAGVAGLAGLAIRHHVTHISATPTFWRAFLMALPEHEALALDMVTLGGEVADQALLDALRARFSKARRRHIYATTEAGAVFAVADGKAGFPTTWLETGIGDTRLSITPDETLAVSSPRVSSTATTSLVDTGDCVVVDGDRVLFRGRRDTMINIGGVKIWAEEVEAHLLKLSFIRDALVTPRANPVTGHILIADIVMANEESPARDAEIKAHLQSLPRAARPAAIRRCAALPLGPTGKKLRRVS